MAILAAALALLAIAWLALLGSVLASRAARDKLNLRLGLVAAPGQADTVPEGGVSGRSEAFRVFDQRVRSVFAYRLPRDWAMRSSGIYLLAVGSILGTVLWLLFSALLHLFPPIAILLVLAAFFLAPRAFLKREQAGAEQEFLNTFPDAIDMAIRMLRAGLPMSAAIRMVGIEGPRPVNEMFRAIAEEMDIGIPFDNALLASGARIGLSDFRFFAVAVALQYSTGGNLALTLETLGEIMRKRRSMRLKGQATTGEERVSAYILGGLPFLVTAVLLLLNPSYLAPLITDPRGNIIVGLALAALLLGFATMNRMMRSMVET